MPQAGGSISDIPKTMIFIDKIENGFKMAKYFWSLLPKSMRKKRDQIIRIFSSNWEPSKWEFFIEEFKNGNTRILIYIDTAKIGVNIRDMACAIQWKIPDYLILATLLQQIGRAKRDKTLLTVSIIFIESKYIFLDDIASVKDSLFGNYKTTLGPNDSAQAAKITSTFHKNNFQNKKVKTPTLYHTLDPAVLWFINTTGCRRRLALACFMSSSFFTRQTAHSCCNNCIYNEWCKIDLVVPIFERHDITA